MYRKVRQSRQDSLQKMREQESQEQLEGKIERAEMLFKASIQIVGRKLEFLDMIFVSTFSRVSWVIISRNTRITCKGMDELAQVLYEKKP